MIPVHAAHAANDPKSASRDFAEMALGEIDAIERGIKIFARQVPCDDGLVIDAIAQDIDSRALLILIEPGTAEALFHRAADALLAYRRNRALLARLLVADAFEWTEPRLLLLARRFTEREESRCQLLAAGAVTCVEVMLVEGASGPRLLPLARAEERATRRTVPIRLFGRAEERRGSRSATIGKGDAGDSRGPPGVARASRGSTGAETRRPASPVGAVSATSGRGPGGGPDLQEEIRRLVLRMSPGIVATPQACGALRFDLDDRLLATLRGDASGWDLELDPSAAAVRIRGPEEVGGALDSLFEKLFDLAATRRRLGTRNGASRHADEPVAARSEG